MKFLFDMFPVLLFFAVLKIYDVYAATAAAMIASVVQISVYWFKHRRFENVHLISFAAIMGLGSLTLILHDETFVKWKPTIVYWVFALVILGSQFIGKQTVFERMMKNQITLPDSLFKKLNFSLGVFFLVLGVLNLYVAFYYGLDLDPKIRTEHWAAFKIVMMVLTFLFMLVLVLFMAPHVPNESPEDKKDKDAVHD